jgi:rhamnopyranosyl-N-acetylglucosaminyl-diphospho-decaprenol beta-1,3/1,4-galactofuranosyltransferase
MVNAMFQPGHEVELPPRVPPAAGPVKRAVQADALAEKVVAVIVSRDRKADLAETVRAVRSQAGDTRLEVIIVDSSADDGVTAGLDDLPGTSVLRSQVNLGGAGGFALGLLSALAAGAHWIWLMDDDGRPMDDGVLGVLLAEAAARGLEAVAPVVLDPENTERFAFPYPIKSRAVFKRDELAADAFIPGMAHLFNGLLLHGSALFKIGLPDLRLFIRGDEIDFLHRMRRAGLKFGTTARACFSHPSSNSELFPVFGGRLHVVYPQASWKRRNQYRNRAYNFTRHHMLFFMAVDFIRYPYFFLFRRGLDFSGLAEWLSCTWEGLRGHVHVEPVIDLSPRATNLPAR